MGPFLMSSRRVGVPIPETMDPSAPLRLDVAAKIAFRDGSHDRVWLSLFQWNHYRMRAEADGPTLPWNLVPRLIRAHRRKAAKRDLPEVAKIRRVTAAEAEFGSPPSRQGSRRAAPREPLAQEIICKAEDQK